MGWTVFHHYKRSEIVDYLRQSMARCSGQTVLRSSAVGNNFWAQLKYDDGRVVIAHVLLRGGTRGDPGYGYKELSHRDGNNCPVAYLSKLPPTEDERELEWRAAVREHHAKKLAVRKQKGALEAGRELIYGDRRYRLNHPLPRGAWNVTCLDDGDNYRMKATQVSQALKRTISA